MINRSYFVAGRVHEGDLAYLLSATFSHKSWTPSLDVYAAARAELIRITVESRSPELADMPPPAQVDILALSRL